MKKIFPIILLLFTVFAAVLELIFHGSPNIPTPYNTIYSLVETALIYCGLLWVWENIKKTK